ncbi:MAG TPA: sigma-70 family RNA polymerase sigma factor [Thermoanaerobaculia bacterium]|nr:sigma-70 family RNA polymerase sigma factor [Thermoanaerobaculia bacterium]
MPEPSELLLQNLPAIQQIITAVCRRKGMDTDEIEEFAGVVRLHLVEDDYAALRAFRGRSSFKTYIAAIVMRLLIDHRRREWGKWRDSAAAERLGSAAVELERRLYRDGRPLEEALTMVAAKHPELTRSELTDLAGQLAPRTRRQYVPLEAAAHMTVGGECDRVEHRDIASRISRVVNAFLQGLPREDQLLLKLRFHSDLTVTEISRSLRLEYQRVWRRLQKLYRDLRQHLEDAGVAAADVEKLAGTDVLLDFHLKNCGVVPSQEGESSGAARQEDMSS